MPDIKVKVKDTSVLVLTDEDKRKFEGLDEIPFEFVSTHDFKISLKDIHAASYILYIASSGRIKILKERHQITH